MAGHAQGSEPDWVVLAQPHRPRSADGANRPRWVYTQVLALTLLVLLAVALVGSYVGHREAESEAVDAAARRTQTLADSVVQPALTDGVSAGDPTAIQRLAAAVDAHVITDGIFRVKIWDGHGVILWSNEPRLVGRQFELEPEEEKVLYGRTTGARISDLDEPENLYERGHGKVLEVYYGVKTPDGTSLLFETYSDYSSVSTRSGQIFRSFATITLASLVALLLLLLPIVWRLLTRLQRGQEQREGLLQQALSASDTERRRIAATLHDGPVQELAATSYVVSAAAQRAAATGQPELAASLEEAALAVRTGIGGLRSLLVDVYPASLADTGLEAALSDLVSGLRTRDIDLGLTAPRGASEGLDPEQTQLVFQVARECLRNAARHAEARHVSVVLERMADVFWMEVSDDGVGFDPAATLADPERGHFGLRLLGDAARRRGAGLKVRSAAGRGTTWLLEVPV